MKAVASVLMVLCLCSFLAGCMDLPEYEEPEEVVFGVSTMTPTPTATPSYVTNQTPFPTPTEERLPWSFRNMTPATPSPESSYTEIYNESFDMEYNVVAFSYDLDHPPMLIKYDFLPVNTTYTRYMTSEYGTHEWEEASVNTYDPNAWAEIKVINRDTGEVVKAGGYSRGYLENFRGTINVNTVGDYQVEIRGNLLTIDISVLVGGTDEGGTVSAAEAL